MSIACVDMSETEIEAFLQVPRFAIMGTNRADGPPQLTPVWYLYEQGKLYVSMYVKSAKYKNLRRDPRASVCIAGVHPDARAVILSGKVELFPAGSAPWIDDVAWRLVRRYYDSDEEARSYQDAEGEGEQADSALAVLMPDKVIAQDYN